MEKTLLTFDKGATCTTWNYCSQRLATGSIDGTIAIFDAPDPYSSSFSCTHQVKAHNASIIKIVWVHPEYGDAVACIFMDGSFSIWEEHAEEGRYPHLKLCKHFKGKSSKVLDVQFGVSKTCLKMVVVYTNGYVKVYESVDPLELDKWKLQAEFQNLVGPISQNGSCSRGSIAWKPQLVERSQLSFVLGFKSDIRELNSPKVWEFDEIHQRWVPVAELALPEEKGCQVFAVAWATNIGRPFELISVANERGIAVWHLSTNPGSDGRLSAQKVAMLSGHHAQVEQLEWDVSGMTLASTSIDGLLCTWQSNLQGVWRQQTAFRPAP